MIFEFRIGGTQINILQAIFLGIVQGLTEFLPISSSGHLVFFQSLFGLEEPQLLFNVTLHLGTLLAVVIFFRTDIKKILQGITVVLKRKKESKQGARLFLWIVIATIPTGLMGVIFHDWFKSLFSKPKIVGVMLLITGLALFLTRWVKREARNMEKMGWMDSILIGVAQGVAIIPGISRAGATISTGLFCGLDRELSGKFSFLLSIPAIFGATLLEVKKMDMGQNLWASVIGSIVAFGVGIFSLTVLMKIIKMGKISNFSYYCWGMGLIMILLTI